MSNVSQGSKKKVLRETKLTYNIAVAGVPLLPPRRPPGQLPVSQGHRLQPEGLRLRLVVQRGLRRLAQLLLPQRRPLLGEGEGHQLFYLIPGFPTTMVMTTI